MAGATLAVPLGILAAGNISPPRPAYWAAHALVLVVRAIPELILAVTFVAAIELRPTAIALALAACTIGFLGNFKRIISKSCWKRP